MHRYTTRYPKTLAGIMLRDLASDLYAVKTQEEAQIWIQRLFNWRVTFKEFLSEMTREASALPPAMPASDGMRFISAMSMPPP